MRGQVGPGRRRGRPHPARGHQQRRLLAQADTQPPGLINLANHRIRRKQVLSGLANEYYIAA
jgi:hypothetical protein